jgi:hypothetical protein
MYMHGPPGEIFPIYIYIYCGEISYILFINSSIFSYKEVPARPIHGLWLSIDIALIEGHNFW